MLSSAPKCRVVCNGRPGEVQDQLADGFRKLRAQGVSEKEALAIARDPALMTRLLPAESVGALPMTVRALIDSGCAECAVNLAYTPRSDAA